MRKPEQLLWDAFKRNCENEFWLQRVENNELMKGMPDVFCTTTPNRVSWIELKVAELPARVTTKVFGDKHGLSTEQKNWHRKYTDKGGRSFILCKVISEEGDQLFLIRGNKGDEFNDMTYVSLALNAAATNWKEIKVVLENLL